MFLFVSYFFCIALALAAIPFFDTILKSIKAIMNGRRPLRLLQGYFDLVKLSMKQTFLSEFTSFFSVI